jgi:hypothetical protein
MEVVCVVGILAITVIAILIFKFVLKELSSKKCNDCDQDGNLQ